MISGYSACIEMLYTELEFGKRPAAALRDGFDAVEFWQWIRHDMHEIADTGVPVALALADSLDVPTHDRFRQIGLLRRESASLFAAVLDETLEVLAPMGTRLIVVSSGNTQEDLSAEEQEENMVECLKAASPLLAKYGSKLCLEPLNSAIDHPGCFLTSSDRAFRAVRAAGDPRIGVLYDIYHQQVTEGNIIASMRSGMDVISHIHAADCPGRHQPGTGELNFANILSAAEAAGYDGYVGFEFIPTDGTSAAAESAFRLLGKR